MLLPKCSFKFQVFVLAGVDRTTDRTTGLSLKFGAVTILVLSLISRSNYWLKCWNWKKSQAKQHPNIKAKDNCPTKIQKRSPQIWDNETSESSEVGTTGCLRSLLDMSPHQQLINLLMRRWSRVGTPKRWWQFLKKARHLKVLKGIILKQWELSKW